MSDGDYQTENWQPPVQKYNIKNLVKNNYVKFDSFRQGNFYYILRDGDFEEYQDYEFVVPIDDIGTATLLAEDRAIVYMRWIRKSIENNTFTKL